MAAHETPSEAVRVQCGNDDPSQVISHTKTRSAHRTNDKCDGKATCNFSRIDNATLILTFKAGSAAAIANVSSEDVTLSTVTGLTNLLIYAENYNVLRIMSGIRFKACSEQQAAVMVLATTITEKQWKCQWVFQPSIYNLLVSLKSKLATLSFAGNSLEPYLRRLLRNQKCQGKVTPSLTVTMIWIGQSAEHRLHALLTSTWRTLRDYKIMGQRKLVISDEGLRDSPAQCESIVGIYDQGRSCLLKLIVLDCLHIVLHQKDNKIIIITSLKHFRLDISPTRKCLKN